MEWNRVGLVDTSMRRGVRRPVPRFPGAAAGTRSERFVREMNTDGVVVAEKRCRSAQCRGMVVLEVAS